MTVPPPRRGGRLRVGIPGDGISEALNPHDIRNTPDVARIQNIFEGLYSVDRDMNTVEVLLEKGTPNEDATEWTFRLRHGVTFHDGKALTADDLLWTISLWTDPANAAVYGITGHTIDPSKVEKVDSLTVRVGLREPNSQFPQLLNWNWFSVFRNGDLPADARIGTGPFFVESFEPGQRSLFRRYPGYWREPAYVDELEIITSYTDDASRLRDLLDGVLDVVPVLAYDDAAHHLDRDAMQVMRRQGNSFQTFYMRVDRAPFDDPRVRMAMRLLVDRQALVDDVLHGLGEPGNDVPGRFCQYYDESLVRKRDVVRARELLAAAGHEGLRLTLQTSTNTTGFVRAAELLRSQAREAGMEIELEMVPAAQYFDPQTHYGKMAFAQSLWYSLGSLPMAWLTAFVRDGQLNETHWADDRTDDLVRQVLRESDPEKIQALWSELQGQQFDDGGWIIWGLPENLDGLAPRVRGMRPSIVSYCDNFEFRHAWLAD